MSDAYFDAARAAGDYPPKGYGWMSEEQQRLLVEQQLRKDTIPRWARNQAVFVFRIPVPLPAGTAEILAALERPALEAAIQESGIRYDGTLADYATEDLREAVNRLAQMDNLRLSDALRYFEATATVATQGSQR